MLGPGTTLSTGRYTILGPLGEGGMGRVYQARDGRLGTLVAVKESFFADGVLGEAFRREARLLSALRHHSLPVVIDYFQEGGGSYLVMDYVSGEDLGRLHERRQARGEGPFPVHQVLEWADQVLDALEYLHGRQPAVLHRDIKPCNLKLTADGALKVLDFGLAKGRAGEMTEAGSVGSVHGSSSGYSPLEQMNGTGTDVRSDLYAVGATIYHLLTGTRPTDAVTRAVCRLGGQPEPVLAAHLVNARVPEALGRVLERALALNPAERPASAGEMRAALRALRATVVEATDPWRTVADVGGTTTPVVGAGGAATAPGAGGGVRAVTQEPTAVVDPPPPCPKPAGMRQHRSAAVISMVRTAAITVLVGSVLILLLAKLGFIGDGSGRFSKPGTDDRSSESSNAPSNANTATSVTRSDTNANRTTPVSTTSPSASDQGPHASENTNEATVAPPSSATPSDHTGGIPLGPVEALRLVGTWRSSSVENGQRTEILYRFMPDGSSSAEFTTERGAGRLAGAWQYSKGVLNETFENGAKARSAIRWIDQDTFELTILDNGIPAYKGVTRVYHRR